MKQLRKLKHKAKYVRSHRHFTKGAIFALGFASVGIITTLAIFAATPTAHFEAESATRTANASTVVDASASGGQAIRFNAPVLATGTFRVVGPDIIGPDGNKFIPIGANVGIRTRPDYPCFAFTQDRLTPGGPCLNATGHADDAVAWGWNMIRVNILTEPAFGVSMDQTVAGVQAVIDEYTARGIVVMPDAHDNYIFSGDVPLSDSRYQFIHTFWERIIPANKDNPYFWVNYVNEFSKNSDTTGLAFWNTNATEYYNRTRALAPSSVSAPGTIFVIDMPNWANTGVRVMGSSTNSTGPNFLAGKHNVVFSWHNYGGSGTQAEMTQQATNMKSKNMAVIIGEFGENWDPTVHENPYPGADAGERNGTKWTFDNFNTFGFGGLWWHGIGTQDNEIFSLHTNGAIAWYRTDQPLSAAGERYFYCLNRNVTNKPAYCSSPYILRL